MLNGGLALLPQLNVPDPRYLAAALGPIEQHQTAEELMTATEHMMLVAFGTHYSVIRRAEVVFSCFSYLCVI